MVMKWLGLCAHTTCWVFLVLGEASFLHLGTEFQSQGLYASGIPTSVALKQALAEYRNVQSPPLLPHPEHLPPPSAQGSCGQVEMSNSYFYGEEAGRGKGQECV